mmetsp:Transcript_66324/g.104917  ORF Transcript_66324/g.104917 Transcript_66324/m.104917 type:complete len:123 (+) Transcript_66324:67-435(+)
MMHKIALTLLCFFAGCEGRRVQVQSTIAHLQSSAPVQVAKQEVKASLAKSPHSKYTALHQHTRVFFVVGSLTMLLVPLAMWLSKLLFNQLDKIAELDVVENTEDEKQVADPRLPQGEASAEQ